MKDLVIIGGPNGAGKTTAAYDLLPQSLAIREFVNADEIARGLSPFDPEGSAIAEGGSCSIEYVFLSRTERALLLKRRAQAAVMPACCARSAHRDIA